MQKNENLKLEKRSGLGFRKEGNLDKERTYI